MAYKRKIAILGIFIFINLIFLVSALPDYFDWRNKDGQNWMTSVKDQGDTCSSCWAFSALGTTEAQYNIAKNNANYDLDLSEEYLVSDCFIGYPYSDCRGGWNYQALQYVKDNGVPNETCFQYNDYNCGPSSPGICNTATCIFNTTNTCSDFTCSDRCSSWQNQSTKIDDYISIPNNKVQIKSYLSGVGPIAASMRWTGGYFDSNNTYRCGTDLPVDHAIIITGYNETGQYWIVKNSWGSNWPSPSGDGYFKVGFGECGIETLTYGVNLTLCTCTSWQAGSCGGPGQSCSTTGYRYYTRTCNPSSCDIESKCQYDSSCAPPAGKEITVCASGCDYATIKNALDHSNPQDRISIIDNRTYNENVVMNSTTASRLECTGNSKIQGSGSGVGIYIKSKDSFSISGCKIYSFSYGIRIYNTDNGVLENSVISNNAYGIFIENQSKNHELINITIKGSIGKGIRLQAETWGSSYVSYNDIEDSSIDDNGYVGIYQELGIYNYYKSNNISNHDNYGIHIYTDGNAFNDILNNKLHNNGKGIYLEVSNSNKINSNEFCPSNTNVDIDIESSTETSGDNNRCEKPGSWNDAGTTGCTYYCDNPPIVTLLYPPNGFTDIDGNVDFVCQATDDYKLVNITLYHNITGIWQANQTKEISGILNITTFSINNIQNGNLFRWNCLAYDNKSRGSFASANWSVNVSIDNTPPNITNTEANITTANLNEYVRVNCTATDSGAGIDTFLIEADKPILANENYSTILLSENTYYADIQLIESGTWSFNCWVNDTLNNLVNRTDGSVEVIEVIPNDTHKFYIKNVSGDNVAWLGNLGNIVLKGKCFSGGNCNNPGNDSFIIRNSTNDNVAFINLTGNLCIEKGDCSDESASCNPTRDAFIIRNSSNYNMSYIDFDGDLCLIGKLYQNNNP